ncbi:MAG: type II secretion system F family protein [Lachnospiraceae bacterium]|nr:type II secretion system F family protein [Lachnospiraceae bacterium]
MDYTTYKLSGTEYIKGILIYAVLSGIIAYFFYKSAAVFFIMIPGFWFFIKLYKNVLKEKRKQKLLEEFSETLNSVSINMRAGYSIENAFLEAYRDIKLFYGEKSLMAEEIMRIRRGLEINITLEELAENLSKRSGAEAIEMFSDVLKSAKRNGGNTTEVLTGTAERIRESICVDAEIENIMAEKKLEFRIMAVMPFVILVYLNITSVGYFDVLYEGIFGRVFMTAALFIYAAALILGRKIMRINV